MKLRLLHLITLTSILFYSVSFSQDKSAPETFTIVNDMSVYPSGFKPSHIKAPCNATTCLTPINLVLGALGTQVCAPVQCNDASQLAGPDFPGANCYDLPNPTIWYSVTAPAGTATFQINISSSTINPTFAVYSTTDCSTFTIYDDNNECYTGAGGTVSGNMAVPAGATLLIGVSAPAGQTGTFTLCVTPQADASACNIGATLVESSSTDATTPVGGPYNPGEVVTFCYTINNYVQSGCNWLQGIVPTFGDCWDPSSFNAQGMPAVTSSDFLPSVGGVQQGSYCTGNWGWYPSGSVLYNTTSANVGAGWFFTAESSTGGGVPADPDNSWGDGNGMCGMVVSMGDCNGSTSGLNWNICFSLTVTTNCATNPDCGVSIKTYSDGEIGNWTQLGCAGDLPEVFSAGVVCCLIVPNAGVNQTICNNATAALSGSYTGNAGATNVAWTASTGTLTNSTTLTPTYTPPPGFSGPVTVTFTVTNTQCTISDQMVINVNPLNTVAAGTSQTVCINSAITPITLATTGATGATVTGLPAGVTGTWAANVVTISGTPTASGPFTYTVTTTGGCPPATTTGTITVTPLNTVAAGTSQTVCINSAITPITLATTGATGATVTGLPTGVTGTWAANVVTISGTPTASGPFTYTVTTTGGCPPATTTGTITVTPLNTVAAGTSQTVCINSAITPITLATTGATGATVTGLPTGVTGTWAANVVTISGTPTASGPFTYTVTTTGGCPPATTTGTITVTPLNTVAAGTSQTVCINSAITPITLATTGATGATVTGLPAGVTGTWAANVVTISGTPTASGPFTYTVTTTGGCPPATTTGTITVTPLNTVAAGTSQTVCINSAITPITLATTGATGATVTGLPAGVTGTWAANVVTISGTPTASGPFTYTVTTTGGCPPATTTGTITVTPLNTVAAGTSQTVCINSAITPITLATTGATGATVTGLPAGVTGTWAANVVTISGTPTASGPFTYTVTTTGGCPPATTTGTITVTPLNTVAAGTSQTVCINSAITPITLATTGATGATVTGLPAGVTGTWAANVVTISGTPTASGPFTYTVTTTGGCPPATTTGTITVAPLNTVAAGTSQTVCINSAITPITLATTGATGATVTGLPAGVTGTWAANVVTISGTPTASGPFTYTVTTTGGCPPATATGTITVTPLNTIAAGTSQTVCINSPITTINLATTGATGATFLGLPAGVIGSWAGDVVTISGTPTASGTFNYTVTTTGGCPPATTTGTITVITQNTIAAGTSQTVCVNSPITTINLATTGATGATFLGLPAGVTGSWAGDVVTISGTPTASGTFNYTVTTTGGCPPATTTGTITVTPLNTIAAGTSQTVCINSPITTINLATTGATGATFLGLPAGVTGSWAGDVVTISGTPTASGTFNYTVTTTGGCPPAITTGTITVTPLNTIAAGTSQTVCINSPITTINLVTTGATGATFLGLPAGVTGSWAGDVATISGTPTSSGTFNYTVTTTGGCPPAITTGTITVTPLNTIVAGTSQTVCINSPITTINLATTGATGATFLGLPAGVTGSWAGDVATISGTPTASGTFNYTVTTTGGCPPAITTGTITVTPLNTIAAGTSQTVCINSPITTINLATTGATGATFLGLPAGVTGSWAGDVVTISGTPTASGTFNYTVTTTGGCPPAITTGTITVNVAPVISATGISPSSCVLLDGTINVALTSGPSSIGTLSWTGATSGSVGPQNISVLNPDITGLGAGTYNVTFADANGCLSNTVAVNLVLPGAPTATITGASGSYCTGNPSGLDVTIVLTGSGGPWNFTYTDGVTPVSVTNHPTTTYTIVNATAGTYTLSLVSEAGCNGTTSGTATITEIPNNTVTAASSNPTLCINTAMTNVTFTTTGATGIGAPTGLPAGVTAAWAGNTITVSGTPTASGTFNYSIPLTGGCGVVSAVGTITVNPDNTVTAASSNPSLCVNTAMTNVTFTTTGATGIGAPTGLPAGVTAAWAGNTITVSGTPTASGTFNYSIPLTGGCGVVSAVGTITVNPDNTVTVASSNPSLCVNTAMTNVTFTTTGATGIGAPTGLPAGVTAAWAGNTITVSGTPTASGTFNYSIPLTGGCGVVSAVGTITVNPDNTVTAASSNPSLCVNTAMTNVTFTTTGATGIGAPTGLPAGVTAAWAGNTITVSGTPTASGTFNYSIPLTGGCGVVNAVGTITVNPDNTVTAASSNPSLCVNTAMTNVTFTTTGATGIGAPTGLPVGVTAAWAGNTITVSGTPTASGTFNYSIPLTGGCGVVNAVGTITVNPDNTVTAASSNPSLCNNTAMTNVTFTTTGATGIGAPTGLPAGVSAAWAGNTITVSGTPTATGTFNYSIPLTGGCGVVNAVGTITVNPDNTVTAASSNPSLCVNTAMTNVTFTTTGATGIGAPTGLPAGVSAAWAGNTITVSGTPTSTGTFNYSIPLTGGCGVVNAVGTITVNPDNTVTAASSNPSLCVNTAMVNVTFTTTGATGIGAPTGLPAGVTAAWAGNTITLSGTPTASGTFNYSIPLTGGCGVVNAVGTITVNPDNTVTAASSNPSLCNNTAMVNVTFTTTGATGIGAPTGLPAGVTAAWAGNTITVSGTPTASGTFNYSIPLTGGCGVVNAVGTITVNPDNTVTAASSNPSLCVNTAMTNVTFTTTGATGIGAPIGLPAGVTAAWAGNTITVSGTPTATGTFNYSIPLTGGCGVVNAVGTITVNPDNTVTAASSNPSLCVNTAMTNVTFTTTGATGIGAPTGLPAGVTAAWAGNTITVSGTPTSTGTFNYSISLIGGCGVVNAVGTITVNPDNTVTAASSNPTLCNNTAMTNVTFTTTGATGIGAPTGLPAGVSAAWAGNTITVSGTPTASGTFNYSIPLTGGCGVVNAVGTITVNPDNTVTAASSNPSLCVNTAMTNVTFTTTGATGIGAPTGLPAGVSAAWAGNTITVSGTPTSTGTFNYSIPLTGGCGVVNAVGTITVNPDNTVTAASSNPSLCVNTAMVNVTFTTTGATGIGAPTGLPAGVSTAWAGNTITVSGTPTASGTFNYSIPLTGGCGVVNAVGTITVYTTPVLNSISDITSCGSVVLPNITGTNTVTPSYWSGTNQTGTQYTPGSVYSIIGTAVLYAYDGANGCSDEVSFNVTISEIPVLTVSDPAAVCEPSTIDLTGNSSTTVGTINYYLDPAMTQIVPSPTSVGNGMYYIQAVNASCTDDGVINVVVNPIPNAPTAGTDTTYCSSWEYVAMTASGSGGTLTWYSNSTLTSVLATGGSLMPTDAVGTTVYYVTETLSGCEGLPSQVTITIQDCEIIVPTAFTPDGDNVNDYWEILDLDAVYPKNIVMVYNRWGNLLYQSEEGKYSMNPWRGDYEGAELPVGSYYFIIDFQDENVEPQKGIVSIVLNK